MADTEMLYLAPTGTRLFIVTHHNALPESLVTEVLAEHQAADERDSSGLGVVTRSLVCLSRPEVDRLWSTVGIQSVLLAMAGSSFEDDTEGTIRVVSTVTWQLVS